MKNCCSVSIQFALSVPIFFMTTGFWLIKNKDARTGAFEYTKKEVC